MTSGIVVVVVVLVVLVVLEVLLVVVLLGGSDGTVADVVTAVAAAGPVPPSVHAVAARGAAATAASARTSGPRTPPPGARPAGGRWRAGGSGIPHSATPARAHARSGLARQWFVHFRAMATHGGKLAGAVAVVVGGHSGFGEAISRLFAREGACVVVAARRAALVEEVAGAIGGVGVACDITDDEQVQRLVATASERCGEITIAVNCAGFEQSTPLAELTPDRLEAMHAVQLRGALSCMRHFGNAMAAHGRGGAFLSLSSLTAHNPARGLAAYASAKAGVEYATKIAAVEYGGRAVRFNTIAASLIETPMTAHIFARPAAIAALNEVTPLGRPGSVDDIARAALFLCGPDGSYVTGQTLCVDGGASLLMLPTPQMYADVARRWSEGQQQQQQQ